MGGTAALYHDVDVAQISTREARTERLEQCIFILSFRCQIHGTCMECNVNLRHHGACQEFDRQAPNEASICMCRRLQITASKSTSVMVRHTGIFWDLLALYR